jgi:hypothetical protein
MSKIKSNSFLSTSPGRTYAMVDGGTMPKKKMTGKKKLISKSGTKMAAYGKGSSASCGCGGKPKFQQGGVTATTGNNIEPGELNPAQNNMFPNAIPAAAASAGMNSSATANQGTIPGSSKQNLETTVGRTNPAGGYDVKKFLKGLSMRRNAVGLAVSNPTNAIKPEAVNQFGSAKQGGSSMQTDSVGKKIFSNSNGLT